MSDIYKTREQLTDELNDLRQTIVEIEMSAALRERVDNELRVNENRYRLLADNISDVIWTMDMNLRFTYVSPSIFNMRGYSAKEAESQSLEEILTPSSYSSMMKVLVEEFAIENMESKDLTRSRTLILEIRRRDGSRIWTETRITFIRDASDRAIGLMGVTRDILERKRMEEQLRQSQLLASLGEMTAGIAHEVNNPLGIILLHSELLNAGNLPDPVKKDLKVIHDEARRAARIMSDLLIYSRGIRTRVRPIDLHRILARVIEMRGYTERVQDINVTTDLQSGPLRVKGNSSQLTQVFMNLMLNAEEALRKSPGDRIINITTRIDVSWAQVSIADNGIGIPENKLNHVFHPFYTTKKIGEGTGLGLSTCYGIISSHGGLIHAENNETGGATLTVELPLVKCTVPERKAPSINTRSQRIT